MVWQIPVLFVLLLGTASYLLRRILAEDFMQYHRLINAVFFLVTLYPLGLIVAQFFPHDLSIGHKNAAVLFIGSSIFPLVNIASFKASEHMEAGSYGLLGNIAPIITIASAMLLLGEVLTPLQILGSAMIISSAIVVTLPTKKISAIKYRSGLGWGLMSVIGAGLAITFERYMLMNIDIGAYFILGWGAQSIWMVMFALPERKMLKQFIASKVSKMALLYGAISSLRGLAFIIALSLSSASIISVSTSFLAVLVVLGGYVFLKESSHVVLKIGAALVGSVGLLLIAI